MTPQSTSKPFTLICLTCWLLLLSGCTPSPDWTAYLGNECFPSLIGVENGLLVVADGQGTLFGLDLKDGTMIWKMPHSFNRVVMNAQGLFLLDVNPGADKFAPIQGASLTKVDITTGAIQWVQKHDSLHDVSYFGADEKNAYLLVNFYAGWVANVKDLYLMGNTKPQPTGMMITYNSQTGKEISRDSTFVVYQPDTLLPVNGKTVYLKGFEGRTWELMGLTTRTLVYRRTGYAGLHTFEGTPTEFDHYRFWWTNRESASQPLAFYVQHDLSGKISLKNTSTTSTYRRISGHTLGMDAQRVALFLKNPAFSNRGTIEVFNYKTNDSEPARYEIPEAPQSNLVFWNDYLYYMTEDGTVIQLDLETGEATTFTQLSKGIQAGRAAALSELAVVEGKLVFTNRRGYVGVKELD